jgi:NitT/TauT family transport system ATP-binding protein
MRDSMPRRGKFASYGFRVTEPVRDVGIVFQRDLLLEWRNVVDNVLLRQRSKLGDQRTRALALLEELGVSGFEKATRGSSRVA